MDEIMKMIDAYCQREFGESADFSNMECIPLAYTTTEDDKHELQINADLVHFNISYHVDDTAVAIERYNALNEMREAIAGMTFDSLVAFANGLDKK